MHETVDHSVMSGFLCVAQLC